MKVHLIKKQTVEDYVTANARSHSSFESWLTLIKRADWEAPSDIVATFNTADILGKGSDRVIFNVGGNNYRVICRYRFGQTKIHLFIQWIGTHAEYDKLCAEGKQYHISAY